MTAGMTEDVKNMLGEPRKALFTMAVPMFISLIISQMNSFVDTFWCSNLGTDALAAVGIVSSLYFLLNGIGNGLGIGVSVAVSKRIGAGEKEVGERIAVQGLVVTLIIALVVTPVFLVLGEPIIAIVGNGVAASESLAYAYPYFCAGLIFFLQGMFSGLLRAEGAARRSMMVMLLSAVFNMVLDPLFVFVLDMGIGGLAWATVVSTLVAILPGVYWYFIGRSTYIQVRPQGYRFDRPLVREFLGIGVPKVVELNIMSVINLALVHFLVVGGGPEGVMLYNTTWRYVSLLMIPSMALGGGLIPICAAAYGGGNFSKLREGYNYALIISLAISTAGALVVAGFSDVFASVFTSTGSALEMRSEMSHTIQLFCIFIPFYAWINIASSLLQSIYMAVRSLYSTLIRNILLVAVFWYTSSLDLEAMWWGLILCEIFGGFLMGLWAEHGLRKRISAHKNVGASPTL